MDEKTQYKEVTSLINLHAMQLQLKPNLKCIWKKKGQRIVHTLWRQINSHSCFIWYEGLLQCGVGMRMDKLTNGTEKSPLNDGHTNETLTYDRVALPIMGKRKDWISDTGTIGYKKQHKGKRWTPNWNVTRITDKGLVL